MNRAERLQEIQMDQSEREDPAILWGVEEEVEPVGEHPRTLGHWYSCEECRHSNIGGWDLVIE